jgi:hypothetical protein
MNLLIVQIFPTSSYLVPLKSKFCPQVVKVKGKVVPEHQAMKAYY